MLDTSQVLYLWCWSVSQNCTCTYVVSCEVYFCIWIWIPRWTPSQNLVFNIIWNRHGHECSRIWKLSGNYTIKCCIFGVDRCTYVVSCEVYFCIWIGISRWTPSQNLVFNILRENEFDLRLNSSCAWMIIRWYLSKVLFLYRSNANRTTI